MATKKKRSRRTDNDDLKSSLVEALRRDVSNEAVQTVCLKAILLDLHQIRVLLEREAVEYNLPALKRPRRKGKVIK